jgi:hypothetical protein
MWGRYCACEILIANPIDFLYATCQLWKTDHNHHFLVIATQLFFFITYNEMKKYISHFGTVPSFHRKIVEICKFDIPNAHINDPSGRKIIISLRKIKQYNTHVKLDIEWNISDFICQEI